jgi:putative CocE/NonD family hydrolase
MFPRVDDVRIPLASGESLSARLWLPAIAEADPVPAILEYIPYRLADWTAPEDAARQPWMANRGYAMVRVDIRGCGDSTGLLRGEYHADEIDEAVEVIAWIAAQPWCTGAVGMWGYSWGGIDALAVAARRPPALKAIITMFACDDRYADDCHYMGGIPLGSDLLKWSTTMRLYMARPPGPRGYPGDWRAAWRERLEAATPWAVDWLAHPTRDDYWRESSVSDDPAAIAIPVLAIGGWADGYPNATLRLLETLPGMRRAIVGPWGHTVPHHGAPGPAIGFLAEAAAWWDRWLVGVYSGVDSAPMLRAYIQDHVAPGQGEKLRPGRWVSEPVWPAPDVATIAARLVAPDVLALREQETADDHAELPLAIRGDQRCGVTAGTWCPNGMGDELPVDQRPDDALSLVFDTDPLEEPLELLGRPVVALRVESDRSQALVAARLCDVAPDGSSLLLSWGMLDLTHRDGHEAPRALTPGRAYDIEVPLRVTGVRIAPGHRLRLAISPTYWPHAWPSPEPATLTVWAGASALRLPVRTSPELPAMPEFGFPEPPCEPVAAERTRCERTRTVEHDGDRVEIVDHEEREIRVLATGEVLSERFTDRWSIRENDPLSATVTCERWCALTGDGPERSIACASTMTADAASFTIVSTLTAAEAGVEFFRDERTDVVPRLLPAADRP